MRHAGGHSLSAWVVLIKNIKSMARLFSEGIVIMYDMKENVNAAAEGMRAAGISVKVVED